ncbi:MAG: class I SAM-dependent methyltransferase [Gammaproteobacteria bacterium]|nr:class I SAM-dependent methyltransferase [Gammaproteobacteria bacterium]
MLSPDQVPQGWGNIATVYERAFEKLTTQFSDEALHQLALRPGEKVLDVATGTGAFSLAAARQGGDVLATDFAEGMIARLQQRIDSEGLENIQAQVMNGQNLELDDDSHHVAASIVGVIFFPDIAKGFAELKRVLKPKGRCAVVCWGDPDKFEMMIYLKRAIQIAAPGFEMPTQTPVWARLTGREQLEKEMNSAGFNNVRVTNMTGKLAMGFPLEFWNDFTSSAPPLAKLFEALGEEKTRETGEVFARLVMTDCHDGLPCLTAEACIGIGEA